MLPGRRTNRTCWRRRKNYRTYSPSSPGEESPTISSISRPRCWNRVSRTARRMAAGSIVASAQTMFFPMRPAWFNHPLPYPGGPAWRDMPLASAVLENGGNSARGYFLIDTGADSIVLPDQISQQLQLDVSTAPSGQAVSFGGTAIAVRYAEL